MSEVHDYLKESSTLHVFEANHPGCRVAVEKYTSFEHDGSSPPKPEVEKFSLEVGDAIMRTMPSYNNHHTCPPRYLTRDELVSLRDAIEAALR